MQPKLIKKGKVKEVYEINSNLEFFFTDQISVFDKIIPTLISFKGETLCRTSAYWFKVAEKLGVKTHFIELSANNKMRVKKVNVISDYRKINAYTKNYLIPLEFIARYFVAGSMHDRIKRGEIDYEKFGFKNMPKYGEEFPSPFIEMTTKLEKVDRNLSEEEALKISGMTKNELSEVKELILKIDDKINSEVKKRGLIHVDGKKEFAFNEERELMVIDTFGTADEDRFWDLEEYEKGNFIELSKEFVRQYYRKIGYYEKLEFARKNKKEEPDIPPLPNDVKNDVSKLYINLFERLTGERWR